MRCENGVTGSVEVARVLTRKLRNKRKFGKVVATIKVVAAGKEVDVGKVVDMIKVVVTGF